MKHATGAALERLAGLLQQIRQKDGIKEPKPGIFYRKSKLFLHFHEDAAGLFADLSTGSEFDRYPVNTREGQRALSMAIDLALQTGRD